MLSSQNIYAEVQLKLDWALIAQNSKFQADLCEILIFVYNGMGELSVIPQKIQEAFLDWANSTSKNLARNPADLENVGESNEILTNRNISEKVDRLPDADIQTFFPYSGKLNGGNSSASNRKC
jgi:hypothetical protein